MRVFLPIILLYFEYGWSITVLEEETGQRMTPKKSVSFFPGPAAESNYVNFTDRHVYRSDSRAPRAEGERKGDPDIKEILTGFVKLFNGPEPSRRRINNRGPPRISDFPPFLLDPLSSPPPTRDPPPYPFEKPLEKVVVKPYATGVPLPEQIVPPRPSKYPQKPIPTKSSATKQELKKTSKPELPIPPVIRTPVYEPQPPPAENNGSLAVATVASTNPSPTEPVSILAGVNISQTSEPPNSDSTLVGTDALPSTEESITSSASTGASPSNSEQLNNAFVSPTPVIESSIPEHPTSKESHKETSHISSSAFSTPYKGFSGRPGIVLDDTEYKPAGAHARPIITAPVADRGNFDVTVSAVQGPLSTYGTPHIFPVELEGVNLPGEVSVITKADGGQHYVSIDGKRTYINLFGTSASSNTAQIKPTSVKSTQLFKSSQGSYSVSAEGKKTSDKGGRRPLPPVRIDTCIVGDWSTCDSEQHETCRTEYGVSSCHCSPAYSRLSHRTPCKRIISLFTSMNVEKLYDQKLTWSEKYLDRDSQEFLELEYEAVKAMQSALSMTPFSDIFMGSKVNSVYTRDRRDVVINVTLMLESNPQTQRTQVRQEVEKEILGAVRRRNFNIGTSGLWASQKATVSRVQDLDECSSPELNDCFVGGQCRNTFGSFECSCPDGYHDEFASNPLKSGRRCETCGPDHCNHRGTCHYSLNGQPVCSCTGNYYGSQCEVDGEVLGVAIGASVAAVIIILSTLACLCMWSRKWNKEAKEIGLRSSVFGYMPSMPSACPTMKAPGMGVPPYTVSMEDRLRWAQIADAIATNHYAPEPVATRPPSAMFRYGTLPVAPLCLPGLGMRPGSVQNLRPESSSEEEDRVDLLDKQFSVPRPKSRASLANQSGIYYDVDYDQQQEQLTVKQGAIPLSTYTLASRSHYGYHG